MANTVLLCPIYKANEKLKLNFTYNSFAKSIIKNSKVRLIQIEDQFQLIRFIKQNSFGNKIYIGMGAGSISNWMRNLKKYFLMKIEDIKKLALSIDGDILFDQSVKNFNWFNIGGKAKVFFKPNSLKKSYRIFKIIRL